MLTEPFIKFRHWRDIKWVSVLQHTMSLLPSFFKQSSASVKTSSRPFSPNPVKINRFKSMFRLIHGNPTNSLVPSVEPIEGQEAVAGGHGLHDLTRLDPVTITVANPPTCSSKDLVGQSTIQRPNIQEGPASDVTPQLPHPHPIPAQDSNEPPNTVHQILATARSAAKMGLEVVKDASSAFPPLNSVAGGLCTILKHIEVNVSPSVCLK
jgi:hypothetical protein